MLRMTYRNKHLGLATYPKDAIWVHCSTSRIVHDNVPCSLEVDFVLEICDTKNKAGYVARLSTCFLRKLDVSKQVQGKNER
jgi:hypothetical protein